MLTGFGRNGWITFCANNFDDEIFCGWVNFWKVDLVTGSNFFAKTSNEFFMQIRVKLSKS
jgi:hypothetical protein